MKNRISAWIVAVATALTVAALNPTAAEADTSDVLIYSAAGAGVAIVIVLLATYFTRDEDQLFLAEVPPSDEQALASERRSIHAGTDCVRPNGTMALLCW